MPKIVEGRSIAPPPPLPPDAQAASHILETTLGIINGARRRAYGNAKESFQRIAQAWSIYLAHDVGAKDVAMMMVLLKVLRERNEHADDNLADICGYAALTAEVYAYDD